MKHTLVKGQSWVFLFQSYRNESSALALKRLELAIAIPQGWLVGTILSFLVTVF